MRNVLHTGIWIWLLSGLVNLDAQSNEGQRFWFSFMEHVDPLENTKVAMITSKSSTSGTVQMPGRNWSQPFTTRANEVTLIRLPAFTETIGSEKVTNTGIQITAAEPISVYVHQYAGARSEAAAILPVTALGNRYYALTYQGIHRRADDFPSELLIVATEDNTQVEVTLSCNTKGGRLAGNKINLTLNAGQTYQIQGNIAEDDLSGTAVMADKNFALFAGAVWTEVPMGCSFRDNLLEQMHPISTWGKQYVTAPNHGVDFDVFRILASENNTRVQISNGPNYLLQAGEFVEYQIRSRSTFVESNRPILLAQYNTGQSCNGYGIGDPSLVILNSIEQTRDTVTLYNSSFQGIEENFINVITRTIDIGVVQLDGRIVEPMQFNLVNGKPGFSYATLQVEPGTHTIISGGCGVLATVYGYGDVESYAYGGGANFTKLNANPIPVGGCLSDTICFDAGLSPRRYAFRWDLGDGHFSEAATFNHQYDELGTYDLTLITHDQCLDLRDTIYQTLEITLRQSLETIPDVKLCEGATLRLGAMDLAGASYHWSGPNGYTSAMQFPIVPNVRPILDGTFEVIGLISGCATFPQSTEVEIVPLPRPNLGPDTIVCDYLGEITLSAGDFTTYRWNDGSHQPALSVDQPGLYWVEVSNDFGCSDSAHINLTRRCPARIFAPNAFTPNGDLHNDHFRIYAEDISSYDLKIFDRWGSLLFQTQDVTDGWDGQHQGKPMPNGVYIWSIQYEGFNEAGDLLSFRQGGALHLLR